MRGGTKVKWKDSASFAVCLSAGLGLLASGCTSPQEYARLKASANDGVNPSINAEQAKDWSKNQTAFLISFNQENPELPPDPDPEWTNITRNGMAFVNDQCNKFFFDLDNYADQQRNLRDSTGLVGTASATLLALANAATSAIAAVGGAFTLTQGLMDSGAQTVLYALPPTRLQALHSKAADAYRAARLGDGSKNLITTRAGAADTIGGYANLCTPVALKGLVGQSLDQVQLGARPGDGRIGVVGFASTSGEALETADQVFGPREAGELATAGGPRPMPLSTPEIDRVFTGPGWTMNELRTLQLAFCIPESQLGIVGPRTIANINMLMTDGSESNPAADAHRINRNFYDSLNAATGGTCDTSRHRNFYENSNYLDLQSENERLQDILVLFGIDAAQAPNSFADSGARELIGRARRTCGLPNEAGDPFFNQVTPDLENRLDNNLCEKQ